MTTAKTKARPRKPKMTLEQINALPLSDLLELSVNDMLAVQKMRGIKLDMGVWHERLGETCHACMAGAVLINTCAVSAEFDGMNAAHNYRYAFMRAVDYMRKGWFICAARALGRPADAPVLCQVEDLVTTAYLDAPVGNGRASVRVYRKAAKILREAGL